MQVKEKFANRQKRAGFVALTEQYCWPILFRRLSFSTSASPLLMAQWPYPSMCQTIFAAFFFIRRLPLFISINLVSIWRRFICLPQHFVFMANVIVFKCCYGVKLLFAIQVFSQKQNMVWLKDLGTCKRKIKRIYISICFGVLCFTWLRRYR